MKRRNFLSNLSIGAAGVGISASCSNPTGDTGISPPEGVESDSQVEPVYRKKIKSSFSTDRAVGGNEKVILALIGAGNWGTNLIINVIDIEKNVEVKYICDVDDTRGGRAMKEVSAKQDFKPIRVRDMRKVFDDDEVDAVIIATPQHWHALATIWACQAGKDVYVEKCVTMNIPEGQKMIEAAMKYERIVQCGMQNRSADFALSARDYIESGALGRIVAVNVDGFILGPVPFKEKEDEAIPDTMDWDMWLGPAPKVPFNISRNKSHGYYWDYSGGLALSNDAIHQVDLMRFLLGNPSFPESVFCTGGRYLYEDNRGVPDYQMITYDYKDYVVTLQTGEFTPYMAKTTPEIRFGENFPDWNQNATKIVIYGSEKQMYVGRMGGGWQVFTKDGQVEAQESGKFPLKAHLANFIDCVRSREQPNCGIIEGHNSSVLVHLANLSYRSGKKQLLFSPEYETILNDATAQSLSQGNYRKGYELPDVI